MSKTSPSSGIARGTGLILIGVGLAPFLSNVLIYFATWQLLAPGATEEILPALKTWLVWVAKLRTLLVLAILPGVWSFAPGWSPRAAAARVLSVIGVLACAINAFMVRTSAPPESIAGGTIAIELGRKGLRKLAIATLVLCCAHVVAVLAHFGYRPLTWLNFGVWVASVICLWRTRWAAMRAHAHSGS